MARFLSEAISTAICEVFRRQRRLDPLLVLALADLDQARVVQAVDRNVAGLRRTHQFHGRGSQGPPVGVVREFLDVFVEVSRLLGASDGREHVTSNLAGLDTDVLIAIAVEHLDDVWIIRRARPRQHAVDAGGMLKSQRQLSDQIADGQGLAVAQCGKPSACSARKPRQYRRQSVDHVRPQALEGRRITRLDVNEGGSRPLARERSDRRTPKSIFMGHPHRSVGQLHATTRSGVAAQRN